MVAGAHCVLTIRLPVDLVVPQPDRAEQPEPDQSHQPASDSTPQPGMHGLPVRATAGDSLAISYRRAPILSGGLARPCR